MPALNAKRQFALEVLEKLRAAGYTAYWAGGCVRDQLLGRLPKDYDVATSATPPQIQQLFGPRRTLAIGAAFGVIAVIGPRPAGQVEVTTFRQDATYSDGRHPDQVTFSSPEEDAKRRDFTINGLFYDPLADQVIDFVGGRDDLERRVIRAIGQPHERFGEDKLRMLRAVRFAATYDFALDPGTEAAIRQMAGDVLVVSPERIAQEMRLMLVSRARSTACRLLRQCGLLAAVLPEVPGGDLWDRTLAVLDRLSEPTFPLAMGALVHCVAEQHVEPICLRWRLSNKETERIVWLVRHHQSLRRATELSWPKLQRLLVTEGIDDLLALHEAQALASDGDTCQIEYCRQKLQLPLAELNPPPLLTGDDLIQHGIARGKIYKMLLDLVRDAQLEKTVHTKDEALMLVDRLLAEGQVV